MNVNKEMTDALLQTAFRLSDAQVQRLCEVHSEEWHSTSGWTPSSASLLELIRKSIVDSVGEDEDAAVQCMHDA